MSTIEQRVSDAILDLEERLADGIDWRTALRKTAKEYDLRDEVLCVRGEKALGPLHLVKVKADRRAENARTQRELERAIDAHVDEDAPQSMSDWLLRKLGREATADELWFAFDRYAERWVRKHAHKYRKHHAVY